MKKTIRGLWLVMTFVITFFIVPTSFADESIYIEYYEKSENLRPDKDRIPIKNCVFGIIKVSDDLTISKSQQEELLKSLLKKNLEIIEREYYNFGKVKELKPTDQNGKTKVEVNGKGVYLVFELDKKNNQISKSTAPFLVIVGLNRGYTVYPKHIPDDETVELSVKKIWEGEKLDKIEVKLLANGKETETVFLSDNNNWKYDFKGLPKKDSNGNLIAYEVKEVIPVGYTAKTEKGDKENSFIITNKKTPSKEIIKTGDISHLYFIGSAFILIAIGYIIYKKED